MSNPQHILVTGGAGFIGSHLVDRLLADGHSVTVIDDLSSGRIENLNGVENEPRLEVVIDTLSDTFKQGRLEHIAEKSGFIFHLAAAVGVEMVIKRPIHTIRTNINETEALLSAAAPHKTPVMLASTSEVYGKSGKRMFSEDDDLLIGPPNLGRWRYACSKLMDEFLALAFATEHHVPVVITRLFNTVGPRQTGRYGMVLPRFIAAAKAGRPLGVYGDGRQTRCFCYVHDAIEAMLRLKANPAAFNEVFNVGSDSEISILHLAKRVVSLLNSGSAIEMVDYDNAYAPGFEDMRRRKPDLQKLLRITGFKPATSLDSIILETAGTLKPE
ncbi:MAG: GDP-mannose 4,6-dehydratase [Verrucomicrobia bacterium]|nr:GDP-mannose 4,6-dehydratase [Verrucomicrobiota bacterium]MCF7709208.1 GDP-mannose 4,6-dehydratase [Verrucomicrobiota bacterium]